MNKQKIWKISILSVAILAVVLAYIFTPLSEYTDPKKIISFTESIPDNWISAAMFLVAFFIGGSLLIPIPLITFAAGLVFGIWKGLALSIVGLILASLSGYLLGRLVDTDIFGEKVKKHIDDFEDEIDNKGPYAVLALRFAPTPPFTITSMLSGALHINIFKYLAASVGGISPLAFSAIFFGKAAIKMMQKPSGLAVTFVIASVVLFGLYYFIKKKQMSDAHSS